MDIRQVSSPREIRHFTTGDLRANYLIEDLFGEDRIQLSYSHLDRTVVGSAVPTQSPLTLESNKQIGSPGFLDRRELGVFNIGGPGRILVDDESHSLEYSDALYVSMGSSAPIFSSDDADNPARFYLVSTPAHARHVNRKITADQARLIELGRQADANVRKLRQYIHPEVCTSCQLVMGMTLIDEGSVWNTMPCHTHDRRSEVYLYFDMAADTRVIHLMGEPQETRHLVVANEQAILSPGWSIHSGCGTARYGFIWSMAGDNQDFDDMDFVAMEALK